MKQKHRRTVCRVRGHQPPVYRARRIYQYDPNAAKLRHVGDKAETLCPRCGHVFSAEERTVERKDAT